VEGDDEHVKVNWQLAMDCDETHASLCPTGALEMFGKRMTVDEVLDEVEKDSSFYRNTEGGITLSGGECMLQPDFSAALLKGAHERGFNTAVETACNVPWANIEKVLPHVDTMQHDHKLTISERHKKWTGVGNERILANFKKAYETFPDIDMVPNLSPQNLVSVEIGKDFMLSHGYVKNDFDVHKWAAPEFLEQAARELLEEQWKKTTTSKLPQAAGTLESGGRIR